MPNLVVFTVKMKIKISNPILSKCMHSLLILVAHKKWQSFILESQIN